MGCSNAYRTRRCEVMVKRNKNLHAPCVMRMGSQIVDEPCKSYVAHSSFFTVEAGWCAEVWLKRYKNCIPPMNFGSSEIVYVVHDTAACPLRSISSALASLAHAFGCVQARASQPCSNACNCAKGVDSARRPAMRPH